MVLIHDMHVLWLRVSSVGMILVAGDRFLLGIGLEPKVTDFWFNQNFDPQLRRPPKNQGELECIFLPPVDLFLKN